MNSIFLWGCLVCVMSGFGVEYVLDCCWCDGWLGVFGFGLECVVDVLVDCVGVDEVVYCGWVGLADSVDSCAGLVVF